MQRVEYSNQQHVCMHLMEHTRHLVKTRKLDGPKLNFVTVSQYSLPKEIPLPNSAATSCRQSTSLPESLCFWTNLTKNGTKGMILWSRHDDWASWTQLHGFPPACVPTSFANSSSDCPLKLVLIAFKPFCAIWGSIGNSSSTQLAMIVHAQPVSSNLFNWRSLIASAFFDLWLHECKNKL